MNTWLPSLALLTCLVGAAWGTEVQLKQDDANRQRCSGMYSQKAWGGPTDSSILVNFAKDEEAGDSDPVVSLLIFEWNDRAFIGQRHPFANPGDDLEVICNQGNIDVGLCQQDDLGAFILEPNATFARAPFFTQAIHLNNAPAIQYPVRSTGYYCISSYAFSNHDYQAVVAFHNAYGELPATQIAKLPFYGGLTITYAVLGIFWAFLYIQNRSDILPVQNYITATLIFLVVEQLITWGFYDYQNRHGDNAFNKVLLVVVSILNAGRNSLSFFLLLIVCMGYGVVKPTLGRTMIYVRILAIVHFVFGVIYAVASLSLTPDNVGPIVLFVILPLAGTLTVFYVWILSSLNLTMKDLINRKQKTKALMYKHLWWCLLGSILVIFFFFFINSIAFAGSSEEDFVPKHWQTRWFVLDGWLNIVYLFDIAFVAYLWRPTANNRRFAMSDELAQDDDGFEIRSIHSRDSLDDLSDINDVEVGAVKAAEELGESASSADASNPTETSRANIQQPNCKVNESKVFKRMESFRFKNLTGDARKRLLLPLSGGVSSLALLHVLDAQLTRQREKQNRTAYDLILVHIETTGEGQDDRELYVSMMAAASTATARSDLEQVFLKRLVMCLAKQHNCESILWGHSDSRLAALALAEVAKGRGGSVPMILSDGRSPAGVRFNYPMRDLFKTELELYASVLPQPLVAMAERGSGGATAAVRNTSIDSLLSTYIMSQAEKYPSIMANVVRTASKLRVAELDDDTSVCVLCFGEVDSPTYDLCYGCRRMQQDIKIAT
ncbi:hypothetical protein DV736_g6097, partial [Chaetothyriales sp. CBS 134916]